MCRGAYSGSWIAATFHLRTTRLALSTVQLRALFMPRQHVNPNWPSADGRGSRNGLSVKVGRPACSPSRQPRNPKKPPPPAQSRGTWIPYFFILQPAEASFHAAEKRDGRRSQQYGLAVSAGWRMRQSMPRLTEMSVPANAQAVKGADIPLFPAFDGLRGLASDGNSASQNDIIWASYGLEPTSEPAHHAMPHQPRERRVEDDEGSWGNASRPPVWGPRLTAKRWRHR